MGAGYFKDGETWRQISKWFVNVPPTAPVLTFDETNEPRDYDYDARTYIQNNLTIHGFDFTNPPQGNTVLLPEFTLGDAFKIEFRIKANPTPSSNNQTACVFSNQHDRQGFFSDHVFAIYQPLAQENFPDEALAIHCVPINDPNGHSKIILSDPTTVTTEASFGGRRIAFDGALDGNWHNVRIEYSFGDIEVFVDNDDGNFSSKHLYRTATAMNNDTARQTSVPHGDGYGASSDARLMSSYTYYASKINDFGFLNDNNSTPRFNGFSGQLSGFKLTTFPSGVERVIVNYKLKDGLILEEGRNQTITDSGPLGNHGRHVISQSSNLYTLWDYSQGESSEYREVFEAWRNEAGTWSKIWTNKLQIFVSGIEENYDLFEKLGSPTQPVEVELHIAPGGVIGATTPNNAALYCSQNLPTGSKVTIYNRGWIIGAGGAGGNCPYQAGTLTAQYVDKDNYASGDVKSTDNTGGSASNVTAGQNGGNAIALGAPTTIFNEGSIYGGGGGSGATLHYNYFMRNRDGRQRWIWFMAPGGGGSGWVPGLGGLTTKNDPNLDYRGNPNATVPQPGGPGFTDNIRASSGNHYYPSRRSDGRPDGSGGFGTGFYAEHSRVFTLRDSRGGSFGEPGKNSRVGPESFGGNIAGSNYAVKIVRENGERGAAVYTNDFALQIPTGNDMTAANNFIGKAMRGGIFIPSNPPSYNDGVGFEEANPTGTVPSAPTNESAGQWGNSCVLSTACFSQGLIEPEELLEFVRWRIRTQSKHFAARQVWLGYRCLFSPLARIMENNASVSKLGFLFLCRPWLRCIKKKANPIERAYIFGIFVLCFIAYYANKKRAGQYEAQELTPLQAMRFYKKIISKG